MDIALTPAPETATAARSTAAYLPADTVSAASFEEAGFALHAVPAPAKTVKPKGWASPGSSMSPAYISLSRDHVAVLRSPTGRLLTPLDLGHMELSTRQAWDTAADTLLRTQERRVEFTVRNATFALGDKAPRGLEVRGGKHPSSAWLAHPRTFKVLHSHFTEVLTPKKELVFVTRDHRELIVLDEDATTVKELFPRAAVFRYSLGFPVNQRGRKQ